MQSLAAQTLEALKEAEATVAETAQAAAPAGPVAGLGATESRELPALGGGFGGQLTS